MGVIPHHLVSSADWKWEKGQDQDQGGGVEQQSPRGLVVVQVELVTHAEPGDSTCKVDILCLDNSTHRCPHCWQAKHSRWYTLVLALITISKAGITLLHAEQ